MAYLHRYIARARESSNDLTAELPAHPPLQPLVVDRFCEQLEFLRRQSCRQNRLGSILRHGLKLFYAEKETTPNTAVMGPGRMTLI